MSKSTCYLVHLDGNNFINMEYSQRYRLFTKKDDAIAWASENGWGEEFGLLGFDDRIGYKNYYAYKDIRISIIRLEVDT